MKYYSEMNDKVYDSVEALEADEARIRKQEEDRKRLAEEAEAKRVAEAKRKTDALKKIDDAYIAYTKAVDEYRKEFGVTLSLKDAFSELLDFIL